MRNVTVTGFGIQKELGAEEGQVQRREEDTLVPEGDSSWMPERSRRTQEGPSLVDIPACATQELKEVGVPSLYRPKMVGPLVRGCNQRRGHSTIQEWWLKKWS